MRHLSALLLVITIVPSVARADAPTPAEQPSPPAAVDTRLRRVALATDPVALLGGTYALSASYVVTRHAAVRLNAEASESIPALADSSTWRTSVSVPLYLDRALHGPYIEPGVVLARRVVGYDITPATDTMAESYYALRTTTIGPQIFVGWQWMFRSGLHVAAAIGASRNWATSGSGSSLPSPESYLRLGFAL